MAEEFEESEVIFHENAGAEDNDPHIFTGDRNVNRNKLKRKKKKNKKKNSVPVNIPEIASVNANSLIQYVDSDYFEDEYDDDGGITPPHVILGRRVAGKMAFSVCTGNGRTLKGRYLSEVRNCILRMTGFLET